MGQHSMNEQENQPEIRDAMGNPGNNPGNSGIPDPRGPEWYKQMYQSIHKKNKHNHYNNRVTSNYTAQSIFFSNIEKCLIKTLWPFFPNIVQKLSFIFGFYQKPSNALSIELAKDYMVIDKHSIQYCLYLLLLFFLDFL